MVVAAAVTPETADPSALVADSRAVVSDPLAVGTATEVLAAVSLTAGEPDTDVSCRRWKGDARTADAPRARTEVERKSILMGCIEVCLVCARELVSG